MSEARDNWLDADIAALGLGDHEKAGLQVYRNYTRAFERRAVRDFVSLIDGEELDLTGMTKLFDLICREEERFLPIIVCAFADDVLKDVFRSIIPEAVPGGKSALFGPFGPFSSLAQLIQLGYAFDVLSADLLLDLNRVRSVRNRISHSWDGDQLRDIAGILRELHPVEALLVGSSGSSASLPQLSPLNTLRIRLIWMVARLVYEAATYNRAKKARLSPNTVLYGKPTTKWLQEISDQGNEYMTRLLRETGT